MRAHLSAALGVELDPVPTNPPTLARGRELYAARCASCHGDVGRGDGPAAAGLVPPPADLTAPALRGSSPLEFYRKINVGVSGTEMKDWESILPLEDRWGGWYVTGRIFGPPYQPLGHRGNLTAMPHPTKGPVIVSDHVSIEWRNSAPETRGYLSGDSDLAALLVFDHQVTAMNLLTRLNREARVPGADVSQGMLPDRVRELADYLLFVDEAALAVTTDPRPGFAAHLAASVPADRRGRSLGELDLARRVFRYPCSYMVYSDAFTALPPAVKDAVYRRLFDVLSGRVADARYARLPAADRIAAAEILLDTRADLPAGLR